MNGIPSIMNIYGVYSKKSSYNRNPGGLGTLGVREKKGNNLKQGEDSANHEQKDLAKAAKDPRIR